MMQKRRVAAAVALLAAMTASYFVGRHHHPQSSNGTASQRHVLYYVDPMHPAYRSDKPGTAPDCGMELQAVYAEDAAGAPAMLAVSSPSLPSGTVRIEDSMQKLLGIRVASVTTGNAARELHVIGRVVPEDTRVYRINVGVDGFIRETYDDAPGTLVKKDQKLAIFYSPDFLSVASGFLAATERLPGTGGGDGSRTVPFPGALSKQGTGSIQGYSDRLLNLGMSDAQIKRIAASRALPTDIDIVAPADGFILSRNISAGQHFEHGMEFYRVADLGQVWVVAEVDEQEAAYLHPGGAATIGLSGRELHGKIAASLPQSEPGGGTVKLRLEVENPGFVMRPDLVVDVKLPIRLPSGITVPVDALVDSGARARVYVERSEGVFEPREVETGWRSDERVEILRGIRPGERVVVAATFLVDSESRLKAPTSTVVREESKATAKRLADSGCNTATAPGAITDQGGTACRNNSQTPTPSLAAKQASGR
jgi:Cu(I)/Ag(I) efflux system membrane fusion protein